MLNLVADGSQLAVLVMLESLVPSMADELSQSFHDSFGSEIRVVPIDRMQRSGGPHWPPVHAHPRVSGGAYSFKF